MSKKKMSTIDLQEDLLISDQKPVNAVSKHSLAARKESMMNMASGAKLNQNSARGSSSILPGGQMINNTSGLEIMPQPR